MKRKQPTEEIGFESLPDTLLLNSVASFLTAPDVGFLKCVTKALRRKMTALWIRLCVWTSDSLVHLREQEWRNVKHFIVSKDLDNLKDLTRLTHLTFSKYFDPPIDAFVWLTAFFRDFNHPLPKLPEWLTAVTIHCLNFLKG